MDEGEMDINIVEGLAEEWLNEVKEQLKGELDHEEREEESEMEAWDDVHGGALPPDKVNAARAEEVGFTEERNFLTPLDWARVSNC